jgi:hypothetical protein
MPLPSQKYGARQCSARSKRSGVRCLNNAVSSAASNVCRMHGYVPKDKVKRGETHGMYKDGNRTQEAQKQSSEQSARLSQYEDALHLLGMTTAKRSPGRKSAKYTKLTSLEDIKEVIG